MSATTQRVFFRELAEAEESESDLEDPIVNSMVAAFRWQEILTYRVNCITEEDGELVMLMWNEVGVVTVMVATFLRVPFNVRDEKHYIIVNGLELSLAEKISQLRKAAKNSSQ